MSAYGNFQIVRGHSKNTIKYFCINLLTFVFTYGIINARGEQNDRI